MEPRAPPTGIPVSLRVLEVLSGGALPGWARGPEHGIGWRMDICLLCTPEVKVLWHQKIFRMSSSFFQEPFRSSSPRSFMPKDLGGKMGKVVSGAARGPVSQPRGLEGTDKINVQSRGA